MHMRTWLRSTLVVAGIIACGVAGTRAAIPDPSGVIRACYNPNGILRIIDPAKSACAAYEKPVSWNVIGPPGPPGEPAWQRAGSNVFRLNGNVGIGLAAPGQRLHIGDGNLLIEGGGETALLFKRDFSSMGMPISGPFANPIFQLGRVTQAGDGDAEFRVLYSDDTTPERSVFEFDRKGIVASVKPDVGSHFEGFVGGDSEPRFRLNSYPFMQLQMGPGGAGGADVAVSRADEPATLVLRTGTDPSLPILPERMRISADGKVGIGTTTPADMLHVAGNVRATSFIAGSTTLNVPDYVFESRYPLMPLIDLGTYVTREKHLPNMPGAAELTREGVNLGRFQMKLLEKVEELTLHAIEQQKALQAQQARIDALETTLRKLAQQK